MEKTLEMRFCQSVRLAVACVLQIVAGTFFFEPRPGTTRLEGLDPRGRKKAEQPTWYNFVFFSRVVAMPIKKTIAGEGMSYWDREEREVLFFCGNANVAVVSLVSEVDHTSSRKTGWNVSKVRYALVGNHRRAGQWVELEPAFPSLRRERVVCT